MDALSLVPWVASAPISWALQATAGAATAEGAKSARPSRPVSIVVPFALDKRPDLLARGAGRRGGRRLGARRAGLGAGKGRRPRSRAAPPASSAANPRQGGRNKYSWLAEFVGHIRDYRVNTVATTRLAIEARSHLFPIAEKEGIDFDVERRGILHIYRDKAGFEAAARVNELLRECGLDRRAVTPEEMLEIGPTIHGSFHGGFFTPSDWTGDIHKFIRGLADPCIRHGTRFIFDADVTGSAHGAGGTRISSRGPDSAPSDETLRVDAVVVCAGTASRRFAAMLGDRVNAYPVKGYSISVHLDDEGSRAAAPTVSLLDDQAKIVTSRLGRDRLLVAGTAEFSGEDHDIRAARIKPLAR